jgi:hypothetical protein
MGFLDNIFSKKRNNLEIDFANFGLSLTDNGKESIRKFASRSDKVRMGDIMMLGDKGDPNFFYLIYYAALFDYDNNVRFAALKRLPNFKDNPNFEILIKKLEEPNVGKELEPYYSMMLSRIGMISESEFNERINGISEQVNDRMPIKALDEARNFVQEHFKNAEETLWISDELNDPMGMNMAIIVDGILKAGYMPDGFDKKNGYRIYKYKKE